MQKRYLMVLTGILMIITATKAFGAQAATSEATEECLDCHATYHPGIVADWRKSRHAVVTPAQAAAVKGLENKLSSTRIPDALKETSVGCAECHTLRKDAHADTFEHNGYDIHVVVSPDDCAGCHTTEREQFRHNIMSMAEKNLSENKLYADMQRTILGKAELKNGSVHFSPANDLTRADACY